ALDEVRVQTSSFAPQYGRLPGAQVALTTRSGSNEIHSTVLYSLRNEALNANDWFANAHAEGRAPERMHDWSVALGGPVRADRTFFFASYEGLRLEQPFTLHHGYSLGRCPRCRSGGGRADPAGVSTAQRSRIRRGPGGARRAVLARRAAGYRQPAHRPCL